MSLYLDGKPMISTSAAFDTHHFMENGTRHVLKLAFISNQKATSKTSDDDLHSLNGVSVMIEFLRGKFFPDDINHADLMLQLDGPPGNQIREQCKTVYPREYGTTAVFSPPSSNSSLNSTSSNLQPQKANITELSWSLIIPYQVQGLLLSVTVQSPQNKRYYRQHVVHYQSTYFLDVGVLAPTSPPLATTSPSWRSQVWVILIGLSTFVVAVHFALVYIGKAREGGKQGYNRPHAAGGGGDDDDYDDDCVGGDRHFSVEFVPVS
jgi:hypothetical protein